MMARYRVLVLVRRFSSSVRVIRSTLSEAFKALNLKRNVEAARALGRLAAEKAKEAGITTVVFDRGGFQYHGKVKALAEAAREVGLIF